MEGKNLTIFKEICSISLNSNSLLWNPLLSGIITKNSEKPSIDLTPNWQNRVKLPLKNTKTDRYLLPQIPIILKIEFPKNVQKTFNKNKNQPFRYKKMNN